MQRWSGEGCPACFAVTDLVGSVETLALLDRSSVAIGANAVSNQRQAMLLDKRSAARAANRNQCHGDNQGWLAIDREWRQRGQTEYPVETID